MNLLTSFLALLGFVFLPSCKPRDSRSEVSGADVDEAQLVERIGSAMEAAELLRPGPGFMQLKGEQLFLHKLRIHELSKSGSWDALSLLAKNSNNAITLQEYTATLGIAGSEVSWTLPALAGFAAPLAVRNLLVQLSDGFYAFDKTAVLPAREDEDGESKPKHLIYRATIENFSLPSKFFGGKAQFLSVDLYTPGTAQAGEVGDSSKELPVDALGIRVGSDEPVFHRPLYYLKNLVGVQVNGLDLKYGSLFALSHEGQTAGSGFGIWLGPDVSRQQLADMTTGLLVLGEISSEAERQKLRRLATQLEAGSKELESAKIQPQRQVQAFDQDGLIVGGFLPDSGLPVVSSAADYRQRAMQKPQLDTSKAPLIGDGDTSSKATALPSSGTWKFVQYAQGSRWSFYVDYNRIRPKGGGGEYIEIKKIMVFQDGYHEVTSTSFSRKTPAANLAYFRRDALWWYLAFERRTDGRFTCGIDYHIYGTPLVGWDTHVRKDGVCE